MNKENRNWQGLSFQHSLNKTTLFSMQNIISHLVLKILEENLKVAF